MRQDPPVSPNEARRILDVDAGATPERLKAAYRRMAKKYHPDRYRTFTEQRWATKKFVRIRAAYEVLSAEAGGRSAKSDGTGPRFYDVAPWTPEVVVEIDADPFAGWRTLVRLLLAPLVLLEDSALRHWLVDHGMGELLQPIVAILVMLFFPAALGLAAVMVPVLFAHAILLGLAAVADHLRPGLRLVDAACGTGVFFLVEATVGGGLLAWIIPGWFGAPELDTESLIVGLVLWVPPAAFLFVEAFGFLATVLVKRRVV